MCHNKSKNVINVIKCVIEKNLVTCYNNTVIYPIAFAKHADSGGKMRFNYDYHRRIDILHVGCEEPRSYFIPYQSKKAAMSDNRGKSSAFVSLCGDWSFKYYPTVNNIDDFTAVGFNSDGMGKLPVPMSWQMMLGRGYDTPHYTNRRDPFPTDPPFIPDDIPCGPFSFIRKAQPQRAGIKRRHAFWNSEKRYRQ